MDAQIKKGVIEMCILHLISSKEKYGYEIMQAMNQVFPDLNESTTYAILKRLHKEGATEIRLGDISGGPTRKYYFITTKGKDLLAQSTEEWKQISIAVASLGIKTNPK